MTEGFFEFTNRTELSGAPLTNFALDTVQVQGIPNDKTGAYDTDQDLGGGVVAQAQRTPDMSLPVSAVTYIKTTERGLLQPGEERARIARQGTSR